MRMILVYEGDDGAKEGTGFGKFQKATCSMSSLPLKGEGMVWRSRCGVSFLPNAGLFAARETGALPNSGVPEFGRF